MVFPYAGKSIAQLSTLIQSGVLDPRELVEQTFDAIKKHEDQAIFTTLLEDRAMNEAQASSKRLKEGRSLGFLDGIPVGWKDLFDLKERVTTAGSIVLVDEEPACEDAAIVQSLARAGMISIGCVNMTEFAFSGLGINPHYGTPHNIDVTGTKRLPGGSSSGSAVSVASGLVPVSIGSDTGGSVRIPASFNGVVGYKATRGRYSMQGVYPLAKNLDSLGPLCRTVQDAIWVDAAMCGKTNYQIEPLKISELRFVVPETVVFDDAEPEVVAAFEATLERLQKAGAIIRRQKFPLFDEILALMAKHGPLVTAEAFAFHHQRLASTQTRKMDHHVVARMGMGAKISLIDYWELTNAREKMILQFNTMVESNELIISPTVPHIAPELDPLLKDDALFVHFNNKTLRNTLIGNFLDWCAVSIPCGKGTAEMPVGFQIAACANRDEYMLAAAMAVEGFIRSDI